MDYLIKKVGLKTFILLQLFFPQINAVLLNFLFNQRRILKKVNRFQHR